MRSLRAPISVGLMLFLLLSCGAQRTTRVPPVGSVRSNLASFSGTFQNVSAEGNQSLWGVLTGTQFAAEGREVVDIVVDVKAHKLRAWLRSERRGIGSVEIEFEYLSDNQDEEGSGLQVHYSKIESVLFFFIWAWRHVVFSLWLDEDSNLLAKTNSGGTVWLLVVPIAGGGGGGGEYAFHFRRLAPR